MREPNIYSAIIERIFEAGFRPGMREVEFRREDILGVARDLGIRLPKNLGDLIYSFRFRAALPEAIQKRAIEEMKHAERLIGRILFLDGRPVVSQLNKITIGPDVEKMHKNDWKAEDTAIKDYNADIRLAVELGDNGSRELFESILTDEEKHIDWIEAQLDQIKQMGIQNYLVEQTG